jgi:hypothetical protein
MHEIVVSLSGCYNAQIYISSLYETVPRINATNDFWLVYRDPALINTSLKYKVKQFEYASSGSSDTK